jgi:quercetin dioxygenase-like cupin family protein
MHVNLESLEQYNASEFVVKAVFKGQRSQAVLLSLLPGQEMPKHAHEAFEVTLMPRRGTATMSVSDKKEVKLEAGMFYYEPAGNTFHIVNTGDEPFQVLIHLIRVT